MKVINEKVLAKYVKEFDGKNTILNLDGTINAKIKMENAKCEYNVEKGTLQIKDKQNTININIIPVYKIQVSENGTMLEIYLDSDLDIILER